MKYLSVCSGIEAATTAWHHLGWKPVAFSEVEPFPSAVLAHHWPDTPNLGDMTKYESWNIGPESVDLLVGGTPCQSFSVAGLRKGLRDPRGGLMLTYLEIAQRLRPRWVVWENVPGVLSSNGGRDFGAFLGALGDLGYGWAYRVLDAQWFGVAQRRRRVFVVGCLGDAASAAAVLFESESVRRDSPPSREKGQGTAGTPASRTSAGGGLGTDFDLAGGLVPSWWDGGQVSQTLDAVLQKGQTMPEKNRFPAVLVPHLGPPWKRVSFAVDCVGGEDDDLGSICSICGLDYTEECQCPGPTQDDMDYCEFAGALYARPHPLAIQAGAIKENPDIGPDGVGVRGDGVSYTLEARAEVQAVAFGVSESPELAHCLRSGASKADKHESTTYVVNTAGRSQSVAYAQPTHAVVGTLTSAGGHAVPGNTVQDVMAGQLVPVAFADVYNGTLSGITAPTMGTRGSSVNSAGPTVLQNTAVRRLTPTECERLQGFPDDHTLIPWRGKPADQCPDGPRYKALGNSMAVPVMRWIGERIQKVYLESLL